MPLDPQAQAMIDQMQAAGAPPLHTLPPEMARQVMAMMRPPSDQIEQVAKVEDRTVPTPDGDVPIRIYTPAGSAPFPVTVYLHGGGWVIGSIETHDPICRALANAAGCIVVSVDYRLAPEAKFPAAVNDSYAATKWVADHCASFGGNPSRVAIAGDSAGGNLAAVVALLAKERGEPKLVFQLLVYPVTEHSFETGSYKANGEGYFLTTDAMRWFWGHYLNDHSDGDNWWASPLKASDLSGLPPALVITAEYDPLRDEGEAYAQKLRQAGVPTESTRYDGMLHGFFTMVGQMDKARQAVDQAATALRSAFGTAVPA